jgi:predicted NAD/FAD-binding protein
MKRKATLGVVAPDVGVALLDVARLWTTNLTGSAAFLMALTATLWSELRSCTPLISMRRSPVNSCLVRPAGESGSTCFTKIPEMPEELEGMSDST